MDLQQLDQFFQALMQEMQSGQSGPATQQAQEMGDQLPQMAQEAAQQGSQAAAAFLEMMSQQQPVAARLGTKLQKVQLLKGQCPEGFEFKTGGKFGAGKCMKCKGGKMKKDTGGQISVKDEWKQNRKAEKKEKGGTLTDKFKSLLKIKA